LTGSGHTCG